MTDEPLLADYAVLIVCGVATAVVGVLLYAGWLP